MTTRDSIVEKTMRTIDRDGMSLSLSDWVEMLNRIRSECESRVHAARDDMKRAASQP